MDYDFEGWATKNDLKCADGLIIRRNAFEVNNGKKVPVVWNHRHESVDNVIGHAILENKDEGVYAYVSLNNTPSGLHAKEVIRHGDVTALSIFANNLNRIGNEILHGVIREVSLVLAGANPGALIESVISHGVPLEDGEEECIIYTGENFQISGGDLIAHDDTKEKPEETKKNKDEEEEKDKGRTVKDVLDEMSDEQKAAVGILIEQAVKDSEKEEKEEKEEEEEMRHNMFERSSAGPSISRSDMKKIMDDAKRLGSLKDSVEHHMQDGVLKHAFDTTGMTVSEDKQNYFVNDPSFLFPEYKTLNMTPEMLSRRMDWVTKLMARVHHTPFSRIKSVYADITENEARAKGYIKGKMKKEEVFTLLKRTTEPQTVYKKQKFDREDVIDITDFDVLAWVKAEMRVMLDEELARAFLIGDGRSSDSEDKIKEDHIRPIVKEAPLFNTIVKVTVPADADEAAIAKATIKAILRGRKKFKGSGKPDFWTTEDVTTEMLLLEDEIGHSIYKTETELATKLRVNEIIPVDPMEEYKITLTENSVTKEYPLIGVITNMADYNVGVDKGGEVNMFDDFDIDYNQMKYLIETRVSGALIKPFSALTIVLDKASAGI